MANTSLQGYAPQISAPKSPILNPQIPSPKLDYGPEKTASSISSRLREYLKERCIS